MKKTHWLRNTLIVMVICGLVGTVVSAFAAGLPPSDDITVLAVEYLSRPNRHVRTFPATQDGVGQASEFLDETLAGDDAAGLPPAAGPKLHVILDEIASNIVKHSGASGFDVDLEFLEDGVKLSFVDDGSPYDPLAHADPDTTLAPEKRPIGGLGIMMVKKMSKSVSYARENSRNFLAVTV